MKRFWTIPVCAVPLIAACSMNQPAAAPASDLPAAAAAGTEILDRTGSAVARADAMQVGDSIRVQVQALRMRPGSYGAHIHAVGRCDGPDFTTAGPHWNPTGQQHGKNNPQGMHKGDLPNLLVGTDGKGSFEMTVPAAGLAGGAAPLLDADGAAIVIHERADDYRTDPSGNSGARIACGLLR
jgi:Cu-Zn family superoxide dismutase